MRKLRNIFAIIAILTVSSCAVDNIDVPSSTTPANDVVTVIGRMTRFDEKDVTTRGVKDENEAKLTSMAVAIFPVNADGTALSGNCVHWQYTDNQAELLFEINRSAIGFTQNARYAMYVFCNMPELEDFGIGSTLEAMLAETQKVDGIDIPANGFPMMGSLGDTFSTTFDRDNQVLILSPTKNNQTNGELLAPTVDGDTQTLLTIPMKAMYAKVNFSIEVHSDQTIEGHYSPQFELKGYTVNNVPSKVDFSYGTNSDSEVSDSGATLGVSGNTVASGANKINFTFYLPERLLTADNSLDSVLPQNLKNKGAGFYDISVDADQNGYRDEDEDYHQRFKSKLLSEDQKATNIVISGQFRDHQNHYWDVDYTIYLGENNSTDFNIKRNSEYNNYVTIRGIQTSNDMSDNTNGIAIDHRVNVTRSQPGIITLRREVLLDSHFEVRPMRIRKSNVNDSAITHVMVEVLNPTTTNWMRLERSFGVGGDGEGEDIYITEGVSAGKRKYFTFDLITGDGTAELGDLAPLTNSSSVVVPLNEGEQCVWIYVDECTEVGDEVRAGIVKVSYGKLENGTFKAANNADYPSVNYVINQRKLFQVTYDDPETTDVENRIYNIEYEEEYLHNFDADDNYGETEYEGMEWGLEGIQLSYDIKAIVSQSGSFDGFKDAFMAGYIPYYDFYISSDDKVMPTKGNRRPFAGYIFCQEIIQDINGYNNRETDPDTNIDVLALNEHPQSAIEYCYNKNKRNRNGQVAWAGNTDNLNWYLPAVDEIEDIVMSKYDNGSKYTYARFIDFQEEYYWSSQPAYYRSLLHYSIGSILGSITNVNDYADMYIDNTNRARATKVSYYSSNFDNVSSGIISGYYHILLLDGIMTNHWAKPYYLYDEITESNPIFNYTHTSQSWGQTNTHTSRDYTKDDLPKFDEGNQLRTEKNRVRCVRKMNTAATE